MTSTLLPLEAAPVAFDLRSWGDRPAVHTEQGTLSYVELADRVDDVATRLGDTRRLVLVEGTNTVPALTAYLGALTRGHVVLLAPPGRPARLLQDRWDPDVVVRHSESVIHEVRPGTRHDLHPDLALLLSTSGSTGAPKLVRLSRTNLVSNAASIAGYLGLEDDDRALTSLPLHYCYGLSVVHSHLLVGASLVLTQGSVVDECFWRLAERAGATSLAAVPYTFELLERSGRGRLELPTLRLVTQAGGRLAPERVLAWSERGRAQGWDLVVMYGQTEATARIAWLPPELAARHPDAIGVPVPGGSLRLDPVPGVEDPSVGELVYSGPNVMLGYAEDPSDLARGPELSELRTGDLARCVGGLYQLVGRMGRQVKLFGLRIDLDHVEAQVPGAQCVVVDEVLHAFTTRSRDAGPMRRALVEATGLPSGAVRVCVVAELPQTCSGKPDRRALADHVRARSEPAPLSLRDDYAVVLGRPDATVQDSFVSLGGDSLSYVELSTRLAARIGDLPRDWPATAIADLEQRPVARAGTRVDSSVLLRAAAILAVVASHANVWTVVGGAHLLLVVAGFNFARFPLAAPTRASRLRQGAASVAQLVLPAAAWMMVAALLAGTYRPATIAMLNGLVGSDEWTRQWQYWFLEGLVWTSAASLAVLAVPALDRLERLRPYTFALSLVVLGLTLRFVWVGLEAGATERYTVGVVAWWFLLGWLAARSEATWQRWLVVGLAALGTVGFFGDVWREALVVAGVGVLALLPSLRLPSLVVSPVSVLASSSLFIYVTHWQVYPHLEDRFPVLATLASVAVGIAYWWVCRPLLRRLNRRLVG